MRVLIDIRHLTHPTPSGVGMYTHGLLPALFDLASQHVFTLLSTGRTPIPPLAKQELGGVHRLVHVPIPNKLLKLSFLATKRPHLTELAHERPDLVFLPNLNYSPLPARTPYALMVHDLSWKIFPECYSWKMRAWHTLMQPKRLIEHAAAILCPSACTKEDVLRSFNVKASNVHVVPHGISPSFSPDQRPQDHGVRSRLHLPKRFALFVGTLEPRKNVLTLIEAVHAYRRVSGDDLHLVLAGEMGWKSGELRSTLANPAIKRWVHQLGYVPSQDRPALYRASAAFIWPSLYEGFGLPVLEAMASGVPVITSHTSSLPELTGGAALLIDPYNVRDLTAALEQLFSSASLQRHLVTSGLTRASAFSWQRTARQTLTVFEQACPK